MSKRILVLATAVALPSFAAFTMASASAPATDPGIGEPHFVALEEIVVPIVDGGHVNGALRVELVLDGVDAAAAARLTATTPELRAASVAAALEFAGIYASGLTAVDAERLSRDLGRALGAKHAGIARVLIVKVAASRI